MRIQKLSFLLTCCLAFILSGATAQAVNLVTVKMQRAYESYYKQEAQRKEFLSEREKASQEASQRQAAFQERVSQLTRMGEELQAPDLSDADRLQKESAANAFLQELQQEEQALLAWRDELLQVLNEKETSARQALLEEIRLVVVDLAKEMKVDLVLDSSDPLNSGVPAVFFAQPSLDITEKVIAKINANAPKQN